MHRQILDAIVSRSPKAIFVDILFLDERPNDGADLLKSYLLRIDSYTKPSANEAIRQAWGVPIYLAKGIDENSRLRSDLVNSRCYFPDPGIGLNSKDAEAIKAECAYFDKRLLPVPKMTDGGVLRSYPAVWPPPERGREQHLTTAFALLREFPHNPKLPYKQRAFKSNWTLSIGFCGPFSIHMNPSRKAALTYPRCTSNRCFWRTTVWTWTR